MANVERPTNHDQAQAPTGARHKLKKLVIELAKGSFGLGVSAGILGGGLYLLSQCHRQPSSPVSSSTLAPAPTIAPTTVVAATPLILATPTAPIASTPQPTPTASPSVPPASPPPTKDPFEDGMKRMLQAGSSGFLELRGKLVRTEDATGPYALFRFRKIYEGTFIFAGANSAQLEEVYYSKADQPAYNYHLYFQESLDKDSRYDGLRQRLDVMLQGFVHTFGPGYDAWAGSDARRTAVLLSNRNIAGSVDVQVHVAFPTPRW
jgi:hypothetical protein